MKKGLIIFGLVFLFLVSSVSATCYISTDKILYAPTTSATSTSNCSSAAEKSKSYTAVWFNGSDVVETDTGTTPSTVGQNFLDTYTFPSGADWNRSYVNLTVNGVFQDQFFFNVTGASAADLIISEAIVGGKWLGLQSSIQATVKDVNGKKVSGGKCILSVWSNDETTMLEKMENIMVDGEIKHGWISKYYNFAESTDYKVKILCYCGGNTSSQECIDEDGNTLQNKVGSVSAAFTTNEWVTNNEKPIPITYSNGTDFPTSTTSLFAGFDTVYYLRNITNNYGSVLETKMTHFIMNNDTGEFYSIPELKQSSINLGNSTTVFNFKIPQSLDTGVYVIKAFNNIYYENILVNQKIMTTGTFNVTSLQDTMTINSITINDYWGNVVNTSSVALLASSMPTSNWTDPYTVLTEGFGYQICGNITNTYSKNIYWHMENLIIHNPTTGWSYEEFHKDGGHWQRVLSTGDSDICWYSDLPLTIPTHSDYSFDFDVYIGDENKAFDCDSGCVFSGSTDYLYVGAIEDSIVFDKWITKPTDTAQGVPAIFIVTESEDYLSMNDDCNYTNQQETDWGNNSFLCDKKDGGGQLILNLSSYPSAGEDFKVCFQTQNYFTEEINLEFYDFYIDNDEGETVIFWEENSDGYIPSIQNDKLWVSETPSRAEELGGNLIDGYGIMCSKWMSLPYNIQGGNNWDIQGKVKINPDIYNLEKDIIWNWESDEFPIFGRNIGDGYPDFITINNVSFTKDNATEGEYFQLEINITNNHLTEEFNTLFHVDFDSNLGGVLRVLKPIPYNNLNWQEQSSYFHFIEALSPGSTSSINSPRFKVPYGMVDIDTYDVIRGHFELHVLSDEESDIFLYSQGWEGTEPTIDIISKDISLVNISVDVYGTTVAACESVIINLTYDNIVSDTEAVLEDDQKYVIHYCLQNTDRDNYRLCQDIVINPDNGEGNTHINNFQLPYLRSNPGANVEFDVFVYTYDPTNLDEACKYCGDEVDSISGNEDRGTFYIEHNSDEDCKYSTPGIGTEDFDLYNLYLERKALEGIENKTGTFHLEIVCPDTTYGEGLTCRIKAFIESGEVEKETDFNCYIDNSSTSVLNFNHMVTQSSYFTDRNFSLTGLGTGVHNVICDASYYNLGSRTDSFSDTFTLNPNPEGVGMNFGLGNVSEVTADEEKKDNKLWICCVIIVIICYWLWNRKKKQKKMKLKAKKAKIIKESYYE